MTEEEKIKGNQLIAGFMRLIPGEFLGKVRYFNYNNDSISNECYLLEELHYHDSWDWLMLVVEKIEEVDIEELNLEYVSYTQKPFTIDSHYKSCKLKVDNDFKLENIQAKGINFTNFVCETKIEAVYKSVVEFIEWYNKQPKC